jgi:hypothetical protein
MTAKKKASIDLCAKVDEILKKHAREAQAQIAALCRVATIDGQIGTGDYFSVTEFALVRHHFKGADEEYHNVEGGGKLIDMQWPKTEAKIR